jgi:hypothetical protein
MLSQWLQKCLDGSWYVGKIARALLLPLQKLINDTRLQ